MTELDWQAYFREFCHLHGKPIEMGGRLVFPDGWSYSATDYAGPEFPPPNNQNECRALQIAYWSEKRRQVRIELLDVAEDLKSLKQLQSVKSVPLRQVRDSRNEKGYVVQGSSQVDWQALLARQTKLKVDLRKIEAQLERLQGGDRHASKAS